MSVVPGKPEVVTMQRHKNDDESDRSEASNDLVAAASFGANRKKRMARQKRVSLHFLPPSSASSGSLYHVPTQTTQDRSAPPAREIDARRLRFLFQKELRKSDVNSLRRMVLPKEYILKNAYQTQPKISTCLVAWYQNQHSETQFQIAAKAHLPPLDTKEGIFINMDDMNGQREWNFKYRFWLNNNGRMYVLENTGEFVRTHGLQHGDFIMLFKDEENQKYVIRARKYWDQDNLSDYTSNHFQATVPTVDDLGMSFSDNSTIFFDEFLITFPSESMLDYPRLEPISSFGSIENINFDEFL